VQSGFDWSLARRDFNCAAETVPQEAGFRIQVSLPRRLRFHACNDCGCSPWSSPVDMQRTEECL
jgi:hypothetical protein